MKWYDGSTYEGQWHQDHRVKGKMIMADGTYYEGEFKNEKYHGRGKLFIKMMG